MFHIFRFLRNHSGSVHVEYSMIALLIGVGVMGVLSAISGTLAGPYDTISAAFASNAVGAATP